MSPLTGPTRVGVFCGPWDSGHVARDGAVLGFEDVERGVVATARALPDRYVLDRLDVTDLLAPDLPARLGRLDVVVGNCGPAAALLMALRERHGLAFRLWREVRTSGWVGYAFQEWAALRWHRPGDACVHTCPSSVALWVGFRGDRGDRFVYPILPARPPRIEVTAPRRAVFTGRLAAEKGLDRVPAIVARLRDAGWPLAEIDLVGSIVDAALAGTVAESLRAQGLSVSLTGPLSHAATQQRLRAADVLLFPTVSSVEGSGRTVVEALGAGTAVIGSDWVASHDLLPPGLRIPLRAGSGRWVSGRDPVPWVDLDLDAWSPPAPPVACEPSPAVDGYVSDPVALARVLDGEPPEAPVPFGPRFRVAWEPGDPTAACEEALERLRALRPSRAALVDLGGAFKSVVLGLGFDPAVRLDPPDGPP